MSQLPEDVRAYLDELVRRCVEVIGNDLLGAWLLGSAAHGAYEHGTSDIDVMLVTGSRWPEDDRRRLGGRLVHPEFPCPTSGLELVWYAAADLAPIDDPVWYQLNVNGGLQRASMISLAPDDSPNYWSVLDLAAARQVGVTLYGAAADATIPAVPAARLHQAIAESLAWHDAADAGSPNRVLNLARLIVLLEEGRWLSKPAGAVHLGRQEPKFRPALDEAALARAEGRWMDPALAAPLSERVAGLLDGGR